MTDLSTQRESTLTTVQRVMAGELDLAIPELQPNRPLQELGVDSLGISEVMFKLEDEFDIRMDDERVPIGMGREIADIVDRLILARDATTS